MIQIHSIKSRCGSQSETENYHHVVENHVVEIHVSQGIAVCLKNLRLKYYIQNVEFSFILKNAKSLINIKLVWQNAISKIISFCGFFSNF